MAEVRVRDLVGRTAEVARVGALFDAAAAGSGGALVLLGDAGIGKSSLLSVGRAPRPGWRVLSVTGTEAEQGIAFAGIISLLAPVRTLLGLLPPAQERVLRLALRLEAEPAVAGTAAVDPAAVDPAAVGVALLGLLSTLSAAGPLALVVDDAQWLDASSLGALGFCARRLDDEPVAVLAAVRADGSGRGSGGAVVPALAGLPILPLGPLAAADVRTLAVGRGLAPRAAERCWRITGGHPLALDELIASLDDDQRAGRTAIEPAGALAGGLPSALARTLDRLPERARHAVLVVALAGRDDVAFLERALTAGDLALTDLDDAERAGVVTRRNGSVTFRHPLVRSAVVADHRADARRNAHARLAAACAIDGDGERRAWHLAASIVGTDAVVAGLLGEVAAANRVRGALAESAAAWLEAARLTADDRAAGALVNDALKDRWLLGDHPGVFALAKDPRGIADLSLRAKRALVVAQAMVWNGRTSEGISLLRRAADDIVASGGSDAPVGLAAHALALAGSFAALDRVDVACELSGRAVQLAETSGDPIALVVANAIHGWHELLAGDVVAAERRLAPVIQIAPLVVTMGAEELHLAQLVAIHHVATERWVEADQLIRTITDHCRDRGWVGAHALASGTAAGLALRRGELRRALALASCELLGGATSPVSKGWAMALLAQINAALGLADAALDHARQAADHADRYGLATVGAWAEHALGHLALSDGKVAEALVHLDHADHEFASRGVREPGLVGWQGDHLEALVLAGRRWEAADGVEAFAEVAERTGRAWAHGVVFRIRAMLASGDERAACYAQALAWHEKYGSPFERARTLLSRGRDERDAGGDGDADLTEAARIFDRIGAARWASQARSLGRSRAVAPSGCRRVIERELSTAELRVADAVARGMTNREAASELFVSVKTVDFHLQNIYRKLGLRSRTELALRVAS